MSEMKKTPQATGDNEYVNALLEKYKNLIESGEQDISLEEMASDYYGGVENLKKEIAEAKKSYESRNKKSPVEGNVTIDYEKIAEKIPVKSGSYAVSGYLPEEKRVIIKDPETNLKESINTAERGMTGSEGDKSKFLEFLERNRYTKSDYAEKIKNPFSDYLGALEHEVGHHATRGGKRQTIGLSGTHMSKSDELANQLGRIQREAYYLYGKRFTPESLETFMQQQKDVPEKERFEQFSPDTRRGLREIYDAYKGEKFILQPGDRVWPTAKESIPFFVKNKSSEKTKTT